MINFVPKGWGYERWITNSELYCGKELFIAKDRRLSLHYHKLKDETFWVLSGEVYMHSYDSPELDRFMLDWGEVMKFPPVSVKVRKEVKFDGTPASMEVHEDKIRIYMLREGDTMHIPVGLRHTLFALRDTRIIEFSTQHFDEDSYRILKGD